MKGKWGYVVNAVVTTFVIVFPEFMLKSHPFYANMIGIILAVVVNSALNPDWRPWKSIRRK